jgi:hypothetical protein
MVIIWRNRPRRAGDAGDRAVAYSAPDEELAALATRFERSCRRHGLALSPNRTWEETMDALPSATAHSLSFDPEAARGFVRAYRAARWGGTTAQEVERLRELLQALEQGTRRRDAR